MIPLAIETLANGHTLILAANNWGDVKKFVDNSPIPFTGEYVCMSKDMPDNDFFCRLREWAFVCSALAEYNKKHTKHEQSNNIQDDDIG